MKIRLNVPFLMSVIVAGIAGCGTTAPRPQQASSTVSYLHMTRLDAESMRLALPALNSEAVAELGNSMISGGRIYSRPAIKIPSEISHNGVNSRGIHYTITIPDGVLFRSGVSDVENSPGTFYEAVQLAKMDVAGYVSDVQGGIFIPDGDPKSTAVYWQDSKNDDVPYVDFMGPIQYENTVFEKWESDSFRRELVYNGRSGQTIKLLYREFTQEMIRPAFTQEVTYDLKAGDIVGFKGSRFKVNNADNTKIQYVVLHHFE